MRPDSPISPTMTDAASKASPKYTIEPIRAADIDGAVTCIQRAFADDTYKNWVFDKATFSTTRNRASLRSRCVWGMQHALFYVAKAASDGSGSDNNNESKVLGVSMWLPPGLARPTSELTWQDYFWSFFSLSPWSDWAAYQYQSWNLWFLQFRTNIRHGRGGLIVRRYYIWKAAQQEAQKQVWDDEMGYYFCNIITADPDVQGLGIGRALMDVVLKQADLKGRKCYLESSVEVPNVAIYERMGFEVVRKMECKDGQEDKGVTLYCMIKQPAA